MDAMRCLDAGLLVRRDYKLIVFERLSLPLALVKIQNPARLGGEIWIAGENPTPMLPRTNSIFMQPTPQRGLAQLSDQATLANMTS